MLCGHILQAVDMFAYVIAVRLTLMIALWRCVANTYFVELPGSSHIAFTRLLFIFYRKQDIESIEENQNQHPRGSPRPRRGEVKKDQEEPN